MAMMQDWLHFVGVWFDLDEANRNAGRRKQTYEWRIWRRVVKAALDEHTKAQLNAPPLPIRAGTCFQRWVHQRWRVLCQAGFGRVSGR